LNDDIPPIGTIKIKDLERIPKLPLMGALVSSAREPAIARKKKHPAYSI
jgi:hypothetical protein